MGRALFAVLGGGAPGCKLGAVGDPGVGESESSIQVKAFFDHDDRCARFGIRDSDEDTEEFLRRVGRILFCSKRVQCLLEDIRDGDLVVVRQQPQERAKRRFESFRFLFTDLFIEGFLLAFHVCQVGHGMTILHFDRVEGPAGDDTPTGPDRHSTAPASSTQRVPSPE